MVSSAARSDAVKVGAATVQTTTTATFVAPHESQDPVGATVGCASRESFDGISLRIAFDKIEFTWAV